MSPGYIAVMQFIADYVENNATGHLKLSDGEYSTGVDSLTGKWKELKDKAVDHAVAEMNKTHTKDSPIDRMDISYNQVCRGFFHGIFQDGCKATYDIPKLNAAAQQ